MKNNKIKKQFYFKGNILDLYDDSVVSTWESTSWAPSKSKAASQLAWRFWTQVMNRNDAVKVKIDIKKLEEVSTK